MSIENGVIKSTFLGREDHGIPTCFVTIEGEWGGSSFGGYDLRSHPDFIDRTLEAVGVGSWEQLVGKPVRVDTNPKGDGPYILRIGHFMKPKWFDPRKEK